MYIYIYTYTYTYTYTYSNTYIYIYTVYTQTPILFSDVYRPSWLQILNNLEPPIRVVGRWRKLVSHLNPKS